MTGPLVIAAGASGEEDRVSCFRLWRKEVIGKVPNGGEMQVPADGSQLCPGHSGDLGIVPTARVLR